MNPIQAECRLGERFQRQLNKALLLCFSPLIEQYITYKNTFGRHDFSAMVGNTWQNGSRSGTIGVRGQDLDLAVRNVLTAPTNLVTRMPYRNMHPCLILVGLIISLIINIY